MKKPMRSILFSFALFSSASLLGAQSSSGDASGSGGPPATIGSSVSVTQIITVPRDSAGEFRSINRPQIERGPAVAAGEHYSAPWLDRRGGPASYGRIIRTTDVPGVEVAEERMFFQHNESVYIVTPQGGSNAVGQRYLAYRLGSALGLNTQIIIPTGILRIEQAGAGGDASVARVMSQYDHVMPTDRLIPLVALPAQSTAAPSAVSSGVIGKISWIERNAALPTIQSYAIVDAGSGAGVRMGDIFTMIRPRVQNYDGTWLPEKELARGRVVRVSEQGSTLLIIKQTESTLRVGTVAKLTAR